MPGRDGTGPLGMGPMTGFGGGQRRGSRSMICKAGFPGWVCGGYQISAKKTEKEFLKQQSVFLENRLQQVKEQIADLKDAE